LSQAFHEPVCGASKLELSITPEVSVHGAGLAEPFSNPELPNNCCAVLTVRLICAVCVCPPPVPVTVTLYVPGGVDKAAPIVSVDVPPPGAPIEDGLNVVAAPDGNPVADNETVELKFPESAEVIVEVPEPPRAIVIDCADDEIVK
jgi:hypothetical protein